MAATGTQRKQIKNMCVVVEGSGRGGTGRRGYERGSTRAEKGGCTYQPPPSGNGGTGGRQNDKAPAHHHTGFQVLKIHCRSCISASV